MARVTQVLRCQGKPGPIMSHLKRVSRVGALWPYWRRKTIKRFSFGKKCHFPANIFLLSNLATLCGLYYAKTGPQLDPRKNVVFLHKNQLKNIKRLAVSFAILFWLSVVSHKNENPGVFFLSVLLSLR